MRKHYISNLRWITVLWLIPYHAACVFRPSRYRDFFVTAPGGKAIYEKLVFLSYPWFMPVLFVLAGVSAYYALDKRTPGQFARERVTKLLVPLAFCTALLSPVQIYFSELSHYLRAPSGSYLEFLKYFFSTDFGGYVGGFSFTGFWYIRFLFYMSIICLPAMVWFKRRGAAVERFIASLPLPAILGLFIFPAEGFLRSRSDYSFPEYICFFLLGFFVLSNEAVQEKIRRWAWPLAALAAALAVPNLYMRCVTRTDYGVTYWVLYRLLRWASVLALFGLAKAYLDRRNRLTDYLTATSYSVYLLHQTILVTIAYYVVNYFKTHSGVSLHAQYFMVVGLTALATFLAQAVIRRIPGLRRMLGVTGTARGKAAQAAQMSQAAQTVPDGGADGDSSGEDGGSTGG